MATQQSQAASSAASASDQGPIGFVFSMFFGAVFTTLFSWVLSIGIELAGMHFFWQERGVLHSRDLVMEELGYISAAPHSVIVSNTRTVHVPLADSPQWRGEENTQLVKSAPVSGTRGMPSTVRVPAGEVTSKRS